MKFLIIDDSEKELDQIDSIISNYLKNHSVQCTIDKFVNYKDFDIHKIYDAYFLDIEMPHDGISLAREIKKINYDAIIIFITNRDDLVYDSFTVHPYDFLRKSCLEASLNQALDSLIEILKRKNRKYLSIKEADTINQLLIKDITYIKSIDHVCYIYIDNKIVKTRTSLYQLENEISNDEFFMVHQSYIVNWNYVSKIEKKTIFLKNTQIPISRYRLKDVMKSYENFILERI